MATAIANSKLLDAAVKASETVRDKLGDVAVQAKDMASAAAKEIGAATGNGPG